MTARKPFPIHPSPLQRAIVRAAPHLAMSGFAFTACLCASAQEPSQPSAAPPADAEKRLDAITVTGARAPAVSLIDRKVYSVGADLRSTTGTASDVLSNLPSVDVDIDGNVSLRGDSRITILIDGRASSQGSGADSLARIPASDIDRVEVITNPSAAFKADGGGGVINVILKKGRKAGVTGGAQANLGTNDSYNAAASASWNTGPWSFSGGLSLRRDIRLRSVDQLRATRDAETGAWTDRFHTVREDVDRLTPGGDVAVDYALREGESIGVVFSRSERDSDRSGVQDDASFSQAGLPLARSRRLSEGDEWRLNAEQGMHYERRLSDDGDMLEINLQRSVEREREHYAYLNSDILPVGPDTRDELRLSVDLVTTELSADYERALGDDATLSLGFNLERDDNAYENTAWTVDTATGALIVDPTVTNAFRYDQSVDAAYVTWGSEYGKLEVLAGLRIENTKTKTHQVTSGESGAHSDLGVYPSLSLARDVGKSGRLKASYGERVTRPDPERLNPFPNAQDDQNLRVGNPALRPEETRSFELGYERDGDLFKLEATAYLRDTRNEITIVTRLLDDGVTLTTRENADRSRAGGLEFSLRGKLKQNLSLNLSGDLHYSEFLTDTVGTSNRRSDTSFSAKAALDYDLTSASTLEIGADYRGARLTPQGEIRPRTIVSLGYKHQITPQWAAVVTVSDLLDSRSFRRTLDTPELQEDSERRFGSREALVSLVYSFGGKKPDRARKSPPNMSDGDFNE